jgi:hypothetical protein
VAFQFFDAQTSHPSGATPYLDGIVADQPRSSGDGSSVSVMLYSVPMEDAICCIEQIYAVLGHLLSPEVVIGLMGEK